MISKRARNAWEWARRATVDYLYAVIYACILLTIYPVIRYQQSVGEDQFNTETIRVYALIWIILWFVGLGVTISIYRQRATSALARAVVRFFVALTVQFFLAAVLYVIAVSTQEEFAFMDQFYTAVPPETLKNITRIAAIYTGLILAVAMIDMTTAYARDRLVERTTAQTEISTFSEETATTIDQTSADVTDVQTRVRNIERKMGEP